MQPPLKPGVSEKSFCVNVSIFLCEKHLLTSKFCLSELKLQIFVYLCHYLDLHGYLEYFLLVKMQLFSNISLQFWTRFRYSSCVILCVMILSKPYSNVRGLLIQKCVNRAMGTFIQWNVGIMNIVREDCWNPINRFTSDTFLGLSQTRTRISNVTCSVLCLFSEFS